MTRVNPALLFGIWAAAVSLAWPSSVRAASGPSPDTARVGLRVGPAFQAHSDLLASPFRQHGTGLEAGATYARNGWTFELGGGVASAVSRTNPAPPPGEDVWSGSVSVRRLWPVGKVAGAALSLGVGASGVASVRRHTYLDGGTEFFADMIAPLSIAAAARAGIGARTDVEEAVDVAVASVLFRSPFAGTKENPTGTVVPPWEASLIRHRLRLSYRPGSGPVLTLSHGLTFLATSRHRTLRIVRQDLSVGIGFVFGRGR